MTPQSLYDLASSAFHDGTWTAYPVDSLPFADDLPEGIGIQFGNHTSGDFPTKGLVLPCHHLLHGTVRIQSGNSGVCRNFYLLDLMAHLVGP